MGLGEQLKKALGKKVSEQLDKQEFVPAPPPKKNVLVATELPVDSDKWIKMFRTIYKHVYGLDFIDDPNLLEVVQKFNTEAMTKGVALIGPPGNGKTSTLVALSYLMNYTTGQRFDKHDTRKVATDFQEHGMIALNQCTRYPALIDDLGAEIVSNHYGNKVNVSKAIIESRYNAGEITHITTNLTTEELEVYIGDRAYDRLRQMCDLHIITAKSKR